MNSYYFRNVPYAIRTVLVGNVWMLIFSQNNVFSFLFFSKCLLNDIPVLEGSGKAVPTPNGELWKCNNEDEIEMLSTGKIRESCYPSQTLNYENVTTKIKLNCLA